MRLTLERWADSPFGVFGTLRAGNQEWYTVERPWLDNAARISCIPPGHYAVQLGTFFSGDGPGGKPDYPAYEILDVPHRMDIKIHRANTAAEVAGCIAPGKNLGWVNERWAVLQSRLAFAEFMVAAVGATDILVSWRRPQ